MRRVIVFISSSGLFDVSFVHFVLAAGLAQAGVASNSASKTFEMGHNSSTSPTSGYYRSVFCWQLSGRDVATEFTVKHLYLNTELVYDDVLMRISTLFPKAWTHYPFLR
ncbi:hypothetical protein EIP91_008390 [Steccherinum ochraceum]|uniref:Secreted protein n=1 Tax=Steccherinum ochraceum TaxID=92696 RepID=A0A4R0R5M7_9APHY|nr:hypothetical protein EIP91_008390 [Steccherinum ochraceum]